MSFRLHAAKASPKRCAFLNIRTLAEPRKPSQFARAPSVGHDGFDGWSFWEETWASLRPSCTHLKQGSMVALPQAGTADWGSMFHSPHSSPVLVNTHPSWNSAVSPPISLLFWHWLSLPTKALLASHAPPIWCISTGPSLGTVLTLSDLLRPGLCSHPCAGGS